MAHHFHERWLIDSVLSVHTDPHSKLQHWNDFASQRWTDVSLIGWSKPQRIRWGREADTPFRDGQSEVRASVGILALHMPECEGESLNCISSLVACGVLICSCSGNSDKPPNKSESDALDHHMHREDSTYSLVLKKVEVLASRAVSIDVDPKSLIDVSGYEEACVMAYCNKDAVIAMIGDTSLAFETRQVALDLTRRFPDDAYTVVLDSCFEYYKRRLITPQFMYYILAAPDWNVYVYKYSENSALRDKLVEVSGDTITTMELRQLIKGICD